MTNKILDSFSSMLKSKNVFKIHQKKKLIIVSRFILQINSSSSPKLAEENANLTLKRYIKP